MSDPKALKQPASVSQLPAKQDVPALEQSDVKELADPELVAQAVLSEGAADLAPQSSKTLSVASADDDEIARSNELAETLSSLQNLIERYANELRRVSDELKEKRESLSNVFDNDAQLGEAEAKVEAIAEEVKTRRSQLQTDPQVTSLKVQIGELNDQKKEIEETLSNHLVNYHQITNSTSFDTSDGDQWDFNIRAKIKSRKK